MQRQSQSIRRGRCDLRPIPAQFLPDSCRPISVDFLLICFGQTFWTDWSVLWQGHPGGLLRNISALTQVWVKPQPAGKVAVLIINAQNATVNASVTLAELNVSASGVSVRDVWRKQELGQASGAVVAEVGPTDSQFLLLTPLSEKIKTDDEGKR